MFRQPDSVRLTRSLAATSSLYQTHLSFRGRPVVLVAQNQCKTARPNYLQENCYIMLNKRKPDLCPQNRPRCVILTV